MALSLKLGKLDAICAKLKSVTKDAPTSPETPNENAPPLASSPEVSESNNNSQKALDFNESFPIKPIAPSTPVIQPTPLLASTPETTKIQQAATPKSSESNGRKKSRKSNCPRNLAHYDEGLEAPAQDSQKDELAAYEINNQDVDFPQGFEDEEGSEMDIYPHPDMSVDSSRATSPGELDSYSVVDSLGDNDDSMGEERSGSFATSGFPLDLSVSRTADEVSLNGSPPSDSDDESINQSDYPSDSVTSASRDGSSGKASADDRILQDYANNTMNELLSIYGLGSGSGSDSASRHVPLSGLSLYQQKSQGSSALAQSNSSKPFTLPASLKPNVPLNGKSLNAGKGIYANFSHQKLAQVNGGPLHSTSHPSVRPSIPGFKPIAPNLKLGAHLTHSTNGLLHPGVKIPSSNKGNVGGEFSKFRLTPSGHKQSHSSTSSGKSFNPDYTKYLKRFHNGEECGGSHCKDLGYREHYHCLDCSFKVFVKKEEMVRHFKWHKKRDDSLQHGFLRFSPMDDCSLKFGPCTHNGRQTHYHCLQQGCDKVYISTSDVQMHANYHRKDSAIIMEGFQRFRATEDCGTPSCHFYGQRTTHFHCRRTSCKFTFKNKADMEKHKTYHQKDEILGRDGFKKFMKYEHCSYKGCRFSKISNHIHCIRDGCNYVLHSTAQLYSHKRKHERRDFENAYRNFRQGHKPAQQPRPSQHVISALQGVNPLAAVGVNGGQLIAPMSLAQVPQNVPSMSLPVKIKMEAESPKDTMEKYMDGKLDNLAPKEPQPEVKVKVEPDVKDMQNEGQSSRLLNHAPELKEEKLSDSLTLPTPSSISPQKGENSSSASNDGTSPSSINGEQMRPSPEKRERDESWKTYLIRYTANDPCNSRCQYLYKDHYHCCVEGCQVLFRSKDGVREHAKFHEIQDRITPLVYVKHEELQACPQNCQYSLKQKHYHCNWTGCSHSIPHVGPAFARLEHYRIHEYAKASAGKGKFGNAKDDEFSKRRRGRPPKYPRTEIPTVPKVELPDSIIQESIRLYAEGKFDPTADVINGFKRFSPEEACPDPQCIHYMKDHFHCARPRCHHATDRMDVLNLHAKDFHNFVTILEGFEFFDRNVDCRRPHCHNNRANRHFHCLKPKCDYSFVRHSTMVQHDRKHKMPPAPKLAPVPVQKKDTSSFIPIVPAMPSMALDPKNKNIVKAAGTFYPMSPLTDIRCSVPNAVFSQPLSVAMANTLTTQSLSAVMAPQSLSMIAQPLQSNITLPSNMATFMPIMAGSQLQVPMSQALPLTMLLQQKGQSFPQPSWSQLRNKMHVAMNQNCGRPFCKLKKKDHYHCMDCNQAFSDPARLRCHMGKHGFRFRRTDSALRAGKPVPLFPKPSSSVGLDLSNTGETADDFDEDKISEGSDQQEGDYEVSASSSLNLNPDTFANILQGRQNLVAEEHSNEEDADEEDEYDEEDREDDMNGNEQEVPRSETSNGPDHYSMMDDDLEENPLVVDESQDSVEEQGEEESVGLNLSLSRRSGRKRTATKHDDFIDSDVLMAKQRKISPVKDQLAVPEGFARYRAGEECGHITCSYRQSGTHYHCTREDCGYGFSDRTRFIQHLMRHERLDNIMGGEFYHFRSSVSCDRPDCDLSVKSSHFHCVKCPYACADSSKVPAHRKYHSKMESIASNGFQKYTGSEDCHNMMCTYYKKQTHYHCTYPACNHAVLGPAQMAAHKVKHPQEELN